MRIEVSVTRILSLPIEAVYLMTEVGLEPMSNLGSFTKISRHGSNSILRLHWSIYN